VRAHAVAWLAVVVLAGCFAQPPDDPTKDYAPLLATAIDALAAQRDAQGLWPAGQVPYVVEAASAAGLDLDGWLQPVPVAQQVAWPAENASFLASLRPLYAVALVAAGVGDEARLAQVRDRVMAGFDGQQFGDQQLLNDDAFALIVLGAAQVAWSSELEPAIAHLLENQTSEGGWSWAVGGRAETDMTGIVLRGLVEAGAIHRVEAGPVLAFLETTRGTEGGYALSPGGQSNCDSTVWGIRTKEALGLADDDAPWRFLFGLQVAGGYAYIPGGPPNALCTAEAATLLGLVVDHQVQMPAGLDRAD
jgi:hypothetical protein